MKLRDYQQHSCAAIWSFWQTSRDPALLVLPTGAGKTQVFCAITRAVLQAAPHWHVLVMAHRWTLIDQAERRLKQFMPDVPIGVWCGTLNRKEWRQITVATIQSIGELPALPDLVIVDEAHAIPENEASMYQTVLAQLPLHARLLGVTATPFRLDGGMIAGPDKLFPRITYRVYMQELISKGHLVPPRLAGASDMLCHEVDRLKITAGDYNQRQLDGLSRDETLMKQQVHDALPRLKDRQKRVWFCINIDHATAVAGEIGEDAVVVHSKMPADARTEALQLFDAGLAKDLVNVNVLTEGWDCPAVDAIVLLRPTASPVFYVQAVGRGLRTSPGKTDCLVLDYARIVETLGPVSDPHIPDAKKRGKADEKKDPPLKICDECYEYVPMATRICPACEAEFPAPQVKGDATPAGGDMLGKAGVRFTRAVKGVGYSDHLAKSGNRCLRLEYKHFLTEGTPEFLSWGHPFAVQKATMALIDLGYDPDVAAAVSSVDDALALLDNDPPAPIDIIEVSPDPKNPKYMRVMRRIRKSEVSAV